MPRRPTGWLRACDQLCLDPLVAHRVDSRILADANGCAPLAGGVAPNFVMLDFVNIGAGLQAVDELNGFSS